MEQEKEDSFFCYFDYDKDDTPFEDNKSFWTLDRLKKHSWHLTKHDSSIYSKYFGLYTSKSWMEENKSIRTSTHHQLRILIQKQTWRALDTGCYQLEDGRGVRLDQKKLFSFLRKTEFVEYCPNDFEFPKSWEKTEVKIFEGDCVDTARYMQREFGAKKVCILVTRLLPSLFNLLRKFRVISFFFFFLIFPSNFRRGSVIWFD